MQDSYRELRYCSTNLNVGLSSDWPGLFMGGRTGPGGVQPTIKQIPHTYTQNDIASFSHLPCVASVDTLARMPLHTWLPVETLARMPGYLRSLQYLVPIGAIGCCALASLVCSAELSMLHGHCSERQSGSLSVLGVPNSIR